MRTVDVCRFAGLTYREADYAVRCGWAHAEGGEGSGNERQWTRTEALIAHCAKRLIKDGFRTPDAWKLARRIQSGETVSLAGGVLSTTGKKFVWADEDKVA